LQASVGKSQALSEDPTLMAEWIWSIALRLRLHAVSWPAGSGGLVQLTSQPCDAPVHELVAHHVHGDRRLALAAFLAIVMSRCGHRFVVTWSCCFYQ